MKKQLIHFAAIAAIAVSATGCASVNKTMKEPYTRVDFTKNDFVLSEQITGQATTTKILGFDFRRWVHSSNTAGITKPEGGGLSFSKIPIVGGYLADKSASYALYDMMAKAPGYDVVFYPQFESQVRRPILGIGFLYKKVTVKATAKLGKLKP